MLDEAWKTAVDALDSEDCKHLIRLARSRIGALVRDVPQAVLDKCEVGSTASIKYQGKYVTGEIQHVDGGCLTLRFSGGEVGMCLIDALLKDGFGKPVTPIPPLIMAGPHPDDAEEIEIGDGRPIVAFGGKVYVLDAEGPVVSQAKAMLVSVVPEALPTRMLKRLVFESKQEAPKKRSVVCL